MNIFEPPSIVAVVNPISITNLMASNPARAFAANGVGISSCITDFEAFKMPVWSQTTILEANLAFFLSKAVSN
ncbi:putative potassium transport system kup 1 [Gossypium arboreum]|uniref:Putative potassium transport system kup 1 n=1 Tax=Gossypium arboreum TaxID=29729 RepID=A0A0B0NMK7_GOSAR|nr:putative potassium transport system kup 1 [Gossypium arboreum]